MPAASKKNTIGRYEVIRRLGRGSQGIVYLGKDPNLEREVAIKVLLPNTELVDHVDADRAALEGRITGRLRHPNVISIYDAGHFHGMPYLVFEYVSGQTVSELLLAEGRLSLKEACAMIGPLVDALATAHAAGITHLDLSPRNILVDRDGVPRIMDFGLSQFTGHMPSREGYALGTLRYMSPEHISGETLGPYTDVFALASTFYEMVTGRPAMHGDTQGEIVTRLMEEPVDLQAIRELPCGESFARFLTGAFEKDYHTRYRDGAALKVAFDRFLKITGWNAASTASEADKHSTVEFLLRRMRRKKDFPVVSRTLLDINRLTAEGSNAAADQLANVILRDFSLTSKLLKLVNSAYYSGAGGEVTSITQAIVILGLKQLRMTTSGLVYTGQMTGAGPELKDSITRSFLAGLIARHLAQRAGLPDAEEAFICGLFQNLGENLVIYYFPEEYAEIKQLYDGASTNKIAASDTVLGISFDELGAAVARTWKLPESIVESIQRSASNDGHENASGPVKLRHVAVFANDLCRIAQLAAAADRETALESLLDKSGEQLDISEDYASKLLAAGMKKLREQAGVFNIDVKRSRFCDAVTAWVDDYLARQLVASPVSP